jgi:MinD-like ATPase involved in chromosome partitioning or flagellar assembly
MDPRMVACGDSGVSFQKSYPDSAVSKAFNAIAERMAQSFLPGR